jgi:hypothetical protein
MHTYLLTNKSNEFSVSMQNPKPIRDHYLQKVESRWNWLQVKYKDLSHWSRININSEKDSQLYPRTIFSYSDWFACSFLFLSIKITTLQPFHEWHSLIKYSNILEMTEFIWWQTRAKKGSKIENQWWNYIALIVHIMTIINFARLM